MLDLFGLSPEQIAENEKWDPSKGERTRDFGDKVGDSVMSFITGRNYAQEVEDAARKSHVDTLTRAAGSSLGRYGSVVGGEDVSDLSTLDSTQLTQRLTSNKNLKDARTQASVTTGRDRTQYTDLNDPDAIMSLAATHVKEDKEKEKATQKSDAAEIRQEGYARQDALLAHQTNETNRRLAHEAAETNKTRLHELAVQEARNAQTMKLAMMDREDKLADRRYAREDRASDRRQQSIMMLIKGLSQLGQGFSL